MSDKGKFVNKAVLSRTKGEYVNMLPKDVEYMDVSPKQIVSAAASLIPFLEHDDANRALMGCNMQRQAVPLLKAESPVVGTGMESKIAVDTGAVVVAEDSGVVERVSADIITIKYDHPDNVKARSFFDASGIVEYRLKKYRRSNQDTCYNQKPLVFPGQKVKKGQVLADGPSTQNGELALGRNLLVSFMPWGGYNFEDAILISERCVREDVFTSLHIEEFELQVRDTKRGVEEITARSNVARKPAQPRRAGVIYTGAR